MRKCKTFKTYVVDYDNDGVPAKEYIEQDGLFDFHDFQLGMAIIEDEIGRVHTLPANQIKFIDPPKIKVDINKQ